MTLLVNIYSISQIHAIPLTLVMVLLQAMPDSECMTECVPAQL